MDNDIKILIESGKWPLAVPNELICWDTPEDKELRVFSIVDIIDVQYENSKILDFGCGDGLVANHLSEKAAHVVGYDLNPSNFVAPNKNVDLTHNFDIVKKNGSYDIILLHDVLDHTQQNILKMIRPLLKHSGNVFVRCHPWISRHGGHMYKEKNMAFIHLLLEPDELKELNLTQDDDHLTTLFPKRYYKQIIDEEGFEIIRHDEHTTPVESFFYENAILRDRIKKWYKTDIGTDFSSWHLQTNFIDYSLKLSDKELNKRPLVAKWDLYVNNRLVQEVYMWEDGTLNQNQNNKWIIKNNTLTFKWSDNKAPDGYWVDNLTMNPEKTEAKGFNQLKSPIRGERKG